MNFIERAINFQDPRDHYVKTSDGAQYAACEDQLLEESESMEESLRRMSISSPARSSLTSLYSGLDAFSSFYFRLLDKIVEKTKTIAMDKLTNIEFWIDHLDSIFTEAEDCILKQDGWVPPHWVNLTWLLTRNLIDDFLRIMNAHLAKTYPDTFHEMNKKNFFPKLADILRKRHPILFSYHPDMDNIENFDPSLSPASHIEEDKTVSQVTGRKNTDCIEKKIQKLKSSNHGKHRVEVRRDSRGQPVISCDGFYFRSKSNLKQDLMGGNNYFHCTFRSCRAFIEIRNGVRYPGQAAHGNHPIPKTLGC